MITNKTAFVAAPDFTERDVNAELKRVRAVPKGMGLRDDQWEAYRYFLTIMMRCVKLAKKRARL